MTLTKAVIPAAGFGTRMLPAAKAVPKELLPVLDKPTIQYVVQEAADAGVREVVLVNSRTKPAIEEHFAPKPELERRLDAKGQRPLLRSIEDLIARVRIHVAYQVEQRGLGDAVASARPHVSPDEPFLCLLGDTIFSGEPTPAAQLLDAYRRFGTTIIGLERVAPEKVERYGIVGGTPAGDGFFKLDTLVEKPKCDAAPSTLAIAARYVLTPAIFDCLDRTPSGAGGEVQLTDALRLLLEREPIHGVVLIARRHDIGNPLEWLKTNLLFALRDARLWSELRPMLEALLSTK